MKKITYLNVRSGMSYNQPCYHVSIDGVLSYTYRIDVVKGLANKYYIEALGVKFKKLSTAKEYLYQVINQDMSWLDV